MITENRSGKHGQLGVFYYCTIVLMTGTISLLQYSVLL